MGRYYSGDIEGKFWFAVQSSTDAEHFGAYESGGDYINYCVENNGQVEEGIQKCLDQLGKNKELLDEFFEINNGYNDPMIVEFMDSKGLKVSEAQVKEMLEVYARLGLGRKIEDFFKENPNTMECYFEAEL